MKIGRIDQAKQALEKSLVLPNRLPIRIKSQSNLAGIYKLKGEKQRQAVNDLLESLNENNADKIHLSPHYLEYTKKLEEEKNKKNETNPN